MKLKNPIMPKYIYKCNGCEDHFEVYHGMNDAAEVCIHCSEKDPHRVPQMPFLKRSGEPKGGKVGDEVKAAIEANKAILEAAKKQSRKEYFDDS